MAQSASRGLRIVNNVEELPWIELWPGTYLKVLHADLATGASVSLLRIDAGASVPEHIHPHAEHIYVTEGTVSLGRESRSLGPGSFVEIPAGQPHGPIRSAQEATLLSTASGLLTIDGDPALTTLAQAPIRRLLNLPARINRPGDVHATGVSPVH
jgi:quercetin dioxygenase-like cupin family protein